MATGSITRKYENTTYYFLSQDIDKETLIYQQIEKSEFDRIGNNTYQDSINGEVQSVEGNAYTNTVNGKNYALVGFYDANGNWQSTGLSSTESKYGSVSNSIQNDKNLKTLLVGSSNTNPTDPNQPGTPGTSTPTSPPNQNTGDSDPILKYPLKMKPEQDKIKFQACKISRSSSSITSSPIYDPVDGPVFLAIQSPISDQNSVDWGPDSVNAIDAAVFDLSYTMITPDDPFGQATQDQLKGAYKNLFDNQNRIRKYLAGQAASLNNVLARTDNIVLNPNLELLFQGPQLRPFSFQFKMSARSQPEADDIKKIIKYFKYHMAVRKETGLFLKAPHVFTIRYLKGETENHPGINLISPSDTEKACALTNCSVDYTPLGSYATYEDGTMVAYTLSLQFQELTPIYDTDYTEGPAASHPIGY